MRQGGFARQGGGYNRYEESATSGTACVYERLCVIALSDMQRQAQECTI